MTPWRLAPLVSIHVLVPITTCLQLQKLVDAKYKKIAERKNKERHNLCLLRKQILQAYTSVLLISVYRFLVALSVLGEPRRPSAPLLTYSKKASVDALDSRLDAGFLNKHCLLQACR